jgi:hypothetical protein
LRVFTWGIHSDEPVLGDFDGDGATDVAVTRQENEKLVWYVLKSGFGKMNPIYSQSSGVQFGSSDNMVVAEDYDNDGKTDIAVFRPENGNWYILRSITNQVQTLQLGTAGDKPQPGDFDGDGDAEPGIFRPSNGTWYTSLDAATNYGAVQWGANADEPISSTANPQ